MFKNKNLKIWVPWPIWAYWLSWLKRKPPPSGTNSNSHSHRTYTKWEIILPRATWSANLSGTSLPLTRHGTSAASCLALRPLRSRSVGTSFQGLRYLHSHSTPGATCSALTSSMCTWRTAATFNDCPGPQPLPGHAAPGSSSCSLIQGWTSPSQITMTRFPVHTAGTLGPRPLLASSPPCQRNGVM